MDPRSRVFSYHHGTVKKSVEFIPGGGEKEDYIQKKGEAPSSGQSFPLRSFDTPQQGQFHIKTIGFRIPSPLGQKGFERKVRRKKVMQEEGKSPILLPSQKLHNSYYFLQSYDALERDYFRIINKLVGRGIIVTIRKGDCRRGPLPCPPPPSFRATSRRCAFNDTKISPFRSVTTFQPPPFFNGIRKEDLFSSVHPYYPSSLRDTDKSNFAMTKSKYSSLEAP